VSPSSNNIDLALVFAAAMAHRTRRRCDSRAGPHDSASLTGVDQTDVAAKKLGVLSSNQPQMVMFDRDGSNGGSQRAGHEQG